MLFLSPVFTAFTADVMLPTFLFFFLVGHCICKSRFQNGLNKKIYRETIIYNEEYSCVLGKYELGSGGLTYFWNVFTIFFTKKRN